MPPKTINPTIFHFISLFLLWKKIAVMAQGMKNIRLIPCALSWLIPAKVVKYIIKIVPPPSPKLPINPDKTAAIISIIIFIAKSPPLFKIKAF